MDEPQPAKPKPDPVLRRLFGAAIVAAIAFAGPWMLAWLAGRGFGLGMIAVSPLVFLWPAWPPLAALLFKRAGAATSILVGLIAFGLAIAGLKLLRPIDGFVVGLAADVSSTRSPEEWREMVREMAGKSGPPADADLTPHRLGPDQIPSAVKSIGPGLNTGFLWFTENGRVGGLTAYGGGGFLHWGVKICIAPTADVPSGIVREVVPGIWVIVN